MSLDFRPWARRFGLKAPACGRWLFCGNVPWADTACNRRLVVFSGFRSLNRGLYWIIYLAGLLSWSLYHPWIAGQQDTAQIPE
jgi:hypothetical protein